jgi:hypothetical protein
MSERITGLSVDSGHICKLNCSQGRCTFTMSLICVKVSNGYMTFARPYLLQTSLYAYSHLACVIKAGYSYLPVVMLTTAKFERAVFRTSPYQTLRMFAFP